MFLWATRHLDKVTAWSYPRFAAVSKDARALDNHLELRNSLLDFIADFAATENGATKAYLDTSRALTLAAHESLGGQPGTAPLVIDPFAGGGSFPLEALRVGAHVFAGDLNPIPFLLNRVALDYAPKYGEALASEVRKWGGWLRSEAERQLSTFYPKERDGGTPVVYLWARTIHCEGPGCGLEIPLLRSMQIDGSGPQRTVVVLTPVPGRLTVEPTVIKQRPGEPIPAGTARRGSVTCPFCHFTTPRQGVERQGQAGKLGQLLLAVAIDGRNGRTYRGPTQLDHEALKRAARELKESPLERLLPTEDLPYLRSIFNVHVYGLRHWRSLFSDRQSLYLSTLVNLITQLDTAKTGLDAAEARALRTVLALVVSKSAMLNCTLARWRSDRGRLEGAFAMQAMPMVWDWGEVNPFNSSVMVFNDLVEAVAAVIDSISRLDLSAGQVVRSSAVSVPLPDDSAAAVLTDPPYYDSIPYANLSDFFYVWLRRMLSADYPDVFVDVETPKATEIVQLAERNVLYAHKTKLFFEEQMVLALSDARRVVAPDGLACIVFAHKTTSGWEALLSAVLKAGWVVTASWPIDTEMATRFKAIGTASLHSSVHLVCRPREHSDGSLRRDTIGDWREVLQELPKRIHEWMPRLAREGVVGADAIFACLGPALEIFSRFSQVEKATGEVVSLAEYLEHVWAAVAREALSTVLQHGDSGSLEPDARLTVMWLWTLGGGVSKNGDEGTTDSDDPDDEDDAASKKPAGYLLEYDAARKIAQGLGASLDALDHLVEVKGDKARLLPVTERTHYLFGKPEAHAATKRPKKRQIELFAEMDEIVAERGWGDAAIPPPGATTLDRVHQAMLLFATGRNEAMKRFLVEEGIGRQGPFWKLSQALAALYPSGSEERRWVEGVLARKKGLGFG